MRNHAARRRRLAGGLSLLELLVALSVAGTLAAFAVPPLGRLVQDGRRASVANELLAAVLQARSDAMRLNRSVVVCGFDDADGDRTLGPAEHRCAGTDWSRGWLVAAWADADRNGRAEGHELDPATLRAFAGVPPGMTVRAGRFTNGGGPGVLVVRPPGQFTSNGTVVVCDARGGAAARALIVSVVARVRIAGTTADGRSLTCP